MQNRLVTLCVLDGWGHRLETTDNAAALAQTPVFDRYWLQSPNCYLRTDGEYVGLPKGQFGNSEVGHMNLGAGRIILQDLPRINQSIQENELTKSPAFGRFVATAEQSNRLVHLIGLLSSGGVHAHQHHILHLAEMLNVAGVAVRVHAILDGRDTPPRTARANLEEFHAAIADLQHVELVSVVGRYYAMDRDRRWQRTKRAYDMMVMADAARSPDLLDHVVRSYDAGISDEFIEPCIVSHYTGMRNGDSILSANFRADRCRQILSALVEEAFAGFDRRRTIAFSAKLGMISYSSALDRKMDVLFPAEKLSNTFGEIVAEAGLPQTRMAETEKYPHVTFFFNGGREEEFERENRVLVPSPKVATYDLKPEMSAPELVKAFVALNQVDGFILINFANTDMVGHTGDLAAAIRAVETVDACLGSVIDKVLSVGGAVMVTADHGNCETMRDPATGSPHTAHTLNPVPCFFAGLSDGVLLEDGKLADVAPTLLEVLAIAKPGEMSGQSLIRWAVG